MPGYVVIYDDASTPEVVGAYDDAVSAFHAWRDFVLATLLPEYMGDDPVGAAANVLGMPGWDDEVWQSLDNGEDGTLYVGDTSSVSVCHAP